jgi:hypothetical protein
MAIWPNFQAVHRCPTYSPCFVVRRAFSASLAQPVRPSEVPAADPAVVTKFVDQVEQIVVICIGVGKGAPNKLAGSTLSHRRAENKCLRRGYQLCWQPCHWVGNDLSFAQSPVQLGYYACRKAHQRLGITSVQGQLENLGRQHGLADGRAFSFEHIFHRRKGKQRIRYDSTRKINRGTETL